MVKLFVKKREHVFRRLVFLVTFILVYVLFTAIPIRASDPTNTTLLLSISASPMILNINQLLTFTVDVKRATTGMLVYEWDLENDGSVEIAKNKYSDMDSVSTFYNQTGSYTAKISVKDIDTNVSNTSLLNILVGNPLQFFNVSTSKQEYKLDEQIVIFINMPQKSSVAYSLQFPDNFVISGNSGESSTFLFSPTKKGTYNFNALFNYYNFSYNTTRQFLVKDNKFFLEINASKSLVYEGNKVDFTVNVHRPTSNTILYKWDFENDGFIDNAGTTISDTLTTSHNFTDYGNYTINISVYDMNTTNSTSVAFYLEVKKFISDTEGPRILIVRPHDNIKIKERVLDIKYNVFDSSDVECTLYFIDGKGFLELIETQDINSNGNGIFKVNGLSNGIYRWQIECIDLFLNKGVSNTTTSLIDSSNNTNETSTNQNLVENNNEQRQSNFVDITKKVDGILSAFEKEEGKKQIIEKTGIKKEIEDFKIEIENADEQIFNIESQQLSVMEKEANKKEIMDNIKDRFKSLSSSIYISDKKEYVKYSVDTDLELVLSSYIKAKNILLKKSSLNDYSKKVREMQEDVTITTVSTKVEVTFVNGTKKQFVFIEKDIGSANEEVLEFIPKEIAGRADEVEVLQQFTVIEDDPILQIQVKNGKISYILKKDINLDEIQKIDTIIFADPSKVLNEESNSILGFVTAPLAPLTGSWKWALLFIGFLIVVVFYLIMFFDWNVNLFKRQKKPILDQRILHHIKKMRNAILDQRMNDAITHYRKIQQIYKYMDRVQKPDVYNTLQQLRNEAVIAFFVQKLEEAENSSQEQLFDSYRTIYGIYQHLPLHEKQKYYDHCMELYERISGE